MNAPTHFRPFARLLHWLMAAMILAMLFIGLGMVSTVSAWHQRLIALHKPLGITILMLAVVRLAFRLRHRPPPLPHDLPVMQKLAAHVSHWLLYVLMIAMPLVGWAMLSAGGYPVMLGASLRLPALMPANATAFAILRQTHTLLALLLLLTFLAHLGAALYHGLIRRDGVLTGMLRGTDRTAPAPSVDPAAPGRPVDRAP